MFRVLSIVLLLSQAVISLRTELVAVPVTVTDARGRHVAGLGQDRFRVYAGGREQRISVFHSGDVPVTLGLVVDRSQSMRPKLAALMVAVSGLLESRGPDDELFGVDFSDQVSPALPGGEVFTNDPHALLTRLAVVNAAGRTALYDGVAEGLRHLELGHSQKNVLVVVSDGGDNASRETATGVLALARRSQAVIYAVALLGTPPAEEDEDVGVLTRLCKETGGVAYVPRSLAETAAASRQIARDLREQYTLGFAPDTSGAAGEFRKIAVTVTAPGMGRMHVRTRAGYVAGGPDGGRP